MKRKSEWSIPRIFLEKYDLGKHMTHKHLAKKAKKYLQHLCLEIPNRRVGSPGNQQATTFFGEVTESFGFNTTSNQFDCIDWTSGGASLESTNASFEVFTSPYALDCRVKAALAVATTLSELELVETTDKILLLRGEIAREQLMPKTFTFYNPDEHKHIYHLLEAKKPLAILTATGHNPQTAGAIYPCPMFEDGDFDIPSVYMSEEEGNRLAKLGGQAVSLVSQSQRIPSTGCNAIAQKKGASIRKLVLTAHIDARFSTPGALDNASGVTTLLLLAELLRDYHRKLGLELIALNGEDYYANPGEMLYLHQNQGKFDQIVLNINIDDVGYVQGDTVFSLYACPEDMARDIRDVFTTHKGMLAGEPWPQGDHMIFVQNQVPAVAITSQLFMQVLGQISHTSQDIPELVDCNKLVDVAHCLRDLVYTIEEFSLK